MSRLFDAMTTNDTYTDNGMPAHSTSGEALVDLFYSMGASRARSDNDVLRDFIAAFGENSLYALKAAFYNRDVRGGQGERRTFRVFFRWLCERYPDVAIMNIANVPYFGRWDDLFVAFDTKVETYALELITEALRSGDGLCAKWMPREGKSNDAIARKIRTYMGLSPRSYRKLLASLTKVVENKMCDNEWKQIDYSKVPSKAANLYRNAFNRHDPSGYSAWTAELAKPEAERDPKVKVNAGAIFPHEIARKLGILGGYYGRNKSNNSAQTVAMLEAQWEALPDYMPKGRRVIPVVDVSGSMMGEPMEVAVSLGLYLAERNKGLFHNQLITFSADPVVHNVKSKRLSDKLLEISRMNWGMNTNVEKVFKLILNSAVKAGLPQDEMPEAILILSDMQFDACVDKASDNALKMIDRLYAQAGYSRPQIVFWNLRHAGNAPVKYREGGTALVSGFSPSIMASVLSGSDLDPLAVVLKTLDNERYDRVAA